MSQVIDINEFLARKEAKARRDWGETMEKAELLKADGKHLFGQKLIEKAGAIRRDIIDIQNLVRNRTPSGKTPEDEYLQKPAVLVEIVYDTQSYLEFPKDA